MAAVESLAGALNDAVHETEPDVAAAVRRGLERGRRMRRNRRIAQVAGSTAAIVAVGAVSVSVAGGGTHHQKPVSPPPASTPTSTPTPHKTASSKNAYYFYMAPSDTVLDVRMHLPALMQQMLPDGTTIALAPKNWDVSVGGATFAVSDATGVSQVTVEAMPLSDAIEGSRSHDGYCDQTHNATKPCQRQKVPGGTIYIADEDRTAIDDNAGQAPAGFFQPGHENDVVWRGQQLTFVPDDPGQTYFRITETTQIEAIPYANTPPAGSKSYHWPPPADAVTGPTGTRLAISPADFAAMIGKPQIGRIQQLFDADVPPPPSTIAERDDINAQIATLAGPLLPTGVKITADYSASWSGFLALTGPTGVNGLLWYTNTHGHGLQTTNNMKCYDGDHDCAVTKVPGGTVRAADRFGRGQSYELEYLPDDPNGKEIAIQLFPTDSATGTMMATPPAKLSPPQLTYDQIVAIVTNPKIADIIQQTNLLGK